MDVIEPFFAEPLRKFKLRELGRITGKDTKTVQKYLAAYSVQGIVKRVQRQGAYPWYESRYRSAYYAYEKSVRVTREVFESGLIEFLEKAHPRCIVLYGSYATGTYHSGSDIDLFVQAKQQHVDVTRFERILRRKIHLFFEQKPWLLSEGLQHNILKGRFLSGETWSEKRFLPAPKTRNLSRLRQIANLP